MGLATWAVMNKQKHLGPVPMTRHPGPLNARPAHRKIKCLLRLLQEASVATASLVSETTVSVLTCNFGLPPDECTPFCIVIRWRSSLYAQLYTLEMSINSRQRLDQP